jgi:hypothetical protein
MRAPAWKRLLTCSPLYGDMKWIIKDSKLVVIDTYFSSEYDFHIRPVGQTEFLMVSEGFENYTIRTSYGFCVHFNGRADEDETKATMNIECYREGVNI